MDRGETVTRQTVRGGTRRLVETGRDLGEEALRIGRQAEVSVGLRVACLPAAVIMDQAPERDVIMALRQEQAAGAQGIANREGERDLPDVAVELAVRDEVGPPVRRDEAVRIVRDERPARAGIERAEDVDRPEQRLAAGGSLERQREKAWQVLAQRAVARQHGVEMPTLLQTLVGAAGLGRLNQGSGVHLVPEHADGLFRIGLGQGVNAAEHAMQPVAGASAHGLAALLDCAAGLAVHRGQEQIVHLDDLVE